MVYDVIGTAALMSGVNLTADMQIRALDRRASAARKAQDRAARKQPPGHAVHPLRAGVVTVVPSQASSNRRSNKRMTLKTLKNAPIDTFHSDDFFYSILKSGPQAIAMLQDLMNTMYMEYQSMPHDDGYEDSLGHYIFNTLDFSVTLADIIDSIQILKSAYDSIETYSVPHAMDSNLNNIYNVSGHIASLLAMHAFYHTDLLRPGNFAPVYSVHLTTTYYKTLCQGLLLTRFDAIDRDILTCHLRCISQHERWTIIDADEMNISPTTQILHIEEDDLHMIRAVILYEKKITFALSDVLGMGDRLLENPKVQNYIHGLSSGYLREKITVNYRELHTLGYFVITEGDAVRVGESLYIVKIDEDVNDPSNIIHIYIPDEVVLYSDQTPRHWVIKMNEDGTGSDSEEDSEDEIHDCDNDTMESLITDFVQKQWINFSSQNSILQLDDFKLFITTTVFILRPHDIEKILLQDVALHNKFKLEVLYDKVNLEYLSISMQSVHIDVPNETLRSDITETTTIRHKENYYRPFRYSH